jgi:benzaldehyde dehydrogenase (NAD)
VTFLDEPIWRGRVASGTGSRFGGSANLGAITGMRWITMRREIAPYPC